MRAIKHSLSPLVLTSSIVSSISLGATGPAVESVLIRMVRLVRPSFRRNAPEGGVTVSSGTVNTVDTQNSVHPSSKNLKASTRDASPSDLSASAGPVNTNQDDAPFCGAIPEPSTQNKSSPQEISSGASSESKVPVSIHLFGVSVPFGWLDEEVVDPNWVGLSPDKALHTLKNAVQAGLTSIQGRASHPENLSDAEADAKDLGAMRQALEDFSNKHHGFAYSPKLKDGVVASLHALEAAISQYAKSMIDAREIPVAQPATTCVGSGMDKFPRVYGDLSFHFLDLDCWKASDLPEQMTASREAIVGHLLNIQQRNADPEFKPSDARTNIADLKAIGQALESASAAAEFWSKTATADLLPLRRQIGSTLDGVKGQIENERVRALGF